MKKNIWKDLEKQAGMPYRRLRDSDNDLVPDIFDCRPHNRYRQDSKPNIMMEQELLKMPLYFSSSTKIGRYVYPYRSKKMSKGAYMAKKRFQSTVKSRPEVIGEIKRQKPDAVVVTSKGIETSGSYGEAMEGEKGSIVILRASSSGRGVPYRNEAKHELAGTAMHELEHVRQFKSYKSKPTLYHKMFKGRYEKQPAEKKARESEEKAEHKHTRLTYGTRKYFWERYSKMLDDDDKKEEEEENKGGE